MEYIVLIIITAGVMGIVISAFSLHKKKRIEGLEYIASSFNLSFSRKSDKSLMKKSDNLDFLRIGHSREVSNLMTGKYGDMNITIADYEYKCNSGHSQQQESGHLQTIIIIQSEYLNLPRFTLSPENIFHKIGSMFGYQDIDFASHPKFSKRYLLQGKDEDAIRESFRDEVMEFYEKSPRLSTGGNKDEFIYYTDSQKMSPKEVKKYLQDAIDLYKLFKKKN